jgi:hypothetical protein
MQIVVGASFDERGAEPAAGRRLDRRAARLDPVQLDLRLSIPIVGRPRYADSSCRDGQSAIFGCVGRQFMQDHHQCDAGLRPHGQQWALSLYPRAAIRSECQAHQLSKIGAGPAFIDEQVVGAGKSVQPADESSLEALQRRAPTERLRSDRLDRSQYILHAVTHLADKDVPMRFRLAPRGDVFDGEQNEVPATFAREPACLEQHGPLTKHLEQVIDAEIRHFPVFLQDLLQQRPQRRDIPLAVAKLEYHFVLGRLLSDLKQGVKGPVGRPDTEVGIENKQRLRDRLDDRMGIKALFIDRIRCLLAFGDVGERQDGAGDAIVLRAVGKQTPQVPLSLIAPDFGLDAGELHQHGPGVAQQVRIGKPWGETPERPTDDRRHEVQQVLAGRREPFDLVVAVEKERCSLRPGQQIGLVVRDLLQFPDLVLELIVDGVKLLVVRLEFLFRRFQLFIGGL